LNFDAKNETIFLIRIPFKGKKEIPEWQAFKTSDFLLNLETSQKMHL